MASAVRLLRWGGAAALAAIVLVAAAAAEEPAAPRTGGERLSASMLFAAASTANRRHPDYLPDHRRPDMRSGDVPEFVGDPLATLEADLAALPDAPPDQALPPIQQELVYRVRQGDSWQRIAARHGTTRARLRRWNHGVSRKFGIGDELRIWVPLGFEPLPDTALGIDRDPTGLPMVAVPDLAKSVGRPARGRLSRGVSVPRNPALYAIRRPDFAYGSSHAVNNLQLAIAKFRHKSGFAGPLVISDMSQRRGRAFGRHSSHQSGRDVDVWLPLKDEVVRERGASLAPTSHRQFMDLAAERAREIDWHATLSLVKALIRTGEVQYIFLSRHRQRYLYRAARAEGMPRELLADLIQYPRKSKTGLVRHSPKHDKHIHVRFHCGSHEHRCR